MMLLEYIEVLAAVCFSRKCQHYIYFKVLATPLYQQLEYPHTDTVRALFLQLKALDI